MCATGVKQLVALYLLTWAETPTLRFWSLSSLYSGPRPTEWCYIIPQEESPPSLKSSFKNCHKHCLVSFLSDSKSCQLSIEIKNHNYVWLWFSLSEIPENCFIRELANFCLVSLCHFLLIWNLAVRSSHISVNIN